MSLMLPIKLYYYNNYKGNNFIAFFNATDSQPDRAECNISAHFANVKSAIEYTVYFVFDDISVYMFTEYPNKNQKIQYNVDSFSFCALPWCSGIIEALSSEGGQGISAFYDESGHIHFSLLMPLRSETCGAAFCKAFDFFIFACNNLFNQLQKSIENKVLLKKYDDLNSIAEGLGL